MSSTSTPARPAARRSPALILVVPLALAVVLTLFAWPSARLAPRDLPVGVAGPAPATRAVEQRLAHERGAFAVHRYDDAAAARAAIERREVYGAFVVDPARGGMTLLTASAASAAVAHALTEAARSAGAHDASGAAVDDVVAAGPSAGALPSAVLPLIIAGSLTAALAAALALSLAGRAALLVAGAALGGVVATAIVQGWLGVIDGDPAANTGAFALMILAVAATVAGLQALLGHAGIAVGVLTMVFVGNPFSAVGTAPELLPQPVGALGQLMPPGAGGNLVRSTGLFDGAAAGGHAAVLAAWALVGVLMMSVPALLRRRHASAAMPSASSRTPKAPAAPPVTAR